MLQELFDLSIYWKSDFLFSIIENNNQMFDVVLIKWKKKQCHFSINDRIMNLFIYNKNKLKKACTFIQDVYNS